MDTERDRIERSIHQQLRGLVKTLVDVAVEKNAKSATIEITVGQRGMTTVLDVSDPGYPEIKTRLI